MRSATRKKIGKNPAYLAFIRTLCGGEIRSRTLALLATNACRQDGKDWRVGA